jgi:hypothetical protein
MIDKQGPPLNAFSPTPERHEFKVERTMAASARRSLSRGRFTSTHGSRRPERFPSTRFPASCTGSTLFTRANATRATGSSCASKRDD